MASGGDHFFETLTAITAVATLPLMILGFVFAGWQVGLSIMVIGWFLLVPIFGVLSDRAGSDPEEIEKWLDVAERMDAGRSGDSRSEDDDDPLETLRERYARGELDDDEFERALEALLETDEGDPERFLERRRGERERHRESEFER